MQPLNWDTDNITAHQWGVNIVIVINVFIIIVLGVNGPLTRQRMFSNSATT